MTARDEVLMRIRQALGPERPQIDVPRAYSVQAPADLALFTQRVSDYRATVTSTTLDDLAAALSRLLPEQTLVPEGIPEAWTVGLRVLRDAPELDVRRLDMVPSVLTTCAVAVAETGTIILDTGRGQGRRALSLVPDHHVVVVRADQVVGSVPEAIARLDPHQPQTWISGPSATSDIELNRVEGVHGPRRLDVVLIR